MKRRHVLRLVSAGTLLAAGCLNSGSSSESDPSPALTPATSQPSTGTRTPTTASPCDVAFPYEETATETADCANPTFVFLGTDSEAAETATGTATPYEYHDYVEVRLTTESAAAIELRGCIDSVENGRVGVSETLSGSTEYTRRFGPFTHHGVNKVELWVEDCDAHRRWPRTG